MIDGTPGSGGDSEAARLRVQLEEARFALDLARQNARRLESELRLLEHRVAEADAEKDATQGRLDERTAYIEGIHRSMGWKALQKVRSFFGRRW